MNRKVVSNVVEAVLTYDQPELQVDCFISSGSSLEFADFAHGVGESFTGFELAEDGLAKSVTLRFPLSLSEFKAVLGKRSKINIKAAASNHSNTLIARLNLLNADNISCKQIAGGIKDGHIDYEVSGGKIELCFKKEFFV